MSKILQHNLDGTSTFIDTRTLQEAHEENLLRIRERVTHLIEAAGYDATWQQNAALGVIDAEEVLRGRQFIAAMRDAYADYKTRLLASSRDEADSVAFVEPPAPAPTYTADQWVDAQGFDGKRPTTLLYLKLQLDAAGKSSPKLAAVQAWLDSLIVAGVTDPTAQRSDWSVSPWSFEEASQEALGVLAQ